MLQNLHIKNFALIDDVSLEFGPGLNLLTGETGAGKSIVIDALGLALGERSSGPDSIRIGAERATVDAVFSLEGAPAGLREVVNAVGVDPDEDDLLIVNRDISRGSARSQCRLNGRPVPTSALRQLSDFLVDVHGQHEHQSLLHQDQHVDLLDNWIGSDALSLRTQAGQALKALSHLQAEEQRIRSASLENERLADLYRFQVQEIDAAGLVEGEEDELQAERLRLLNAGRLSTACTEAYGGLSGNEGVSALDALNKAYAAVQHAVTWDEALEPIAESIAGAVSLAEDAAAALRLYPETLQFDPLRQDQIDSRLELIRSFKRKYGETLAAILAYRDAAADKLDIFENGELRLDDLQRQIQAATGVLADTNRRLTELRREQGSQFAALICVELQDLGMAATRFDVAIEPQSPSAKGADRVEFMISPNPGEPLRALSKIASGGEMSRVMLAIKSVLVHSGAVPTMVFDEIDVGIGGRTGEVIAAKLESLAKEAQILCITHLPQIAAGSAVHFKIEKTQLLDSTTVSVEKLTDEGRVEEIARMLGGSRRTPAVLQNARELLGHLHKP